MKNWYFWTVMLEKTVESPLDCKEIKPVHPKGNQSWMFTGRTDAEAETPIFWPPDAKCWLIWKDLMLGNIEGRKRRGQQRMRTVGWHDWLNGHEFEQTLGVGDGQGGLLQSLGSQRVGHNWVIELNWTKQWLESKIVDSICLLNASFVSKLVKNLPAIQETWFNPWVSKVPRRRERLPTPVFWLREFHGLYNPWGHKESDMSEWLSLTLYWMLKENLVILVAALSCDVYS